MSNNLRSFNKLSENNAAHTEKLRLLKENYIRKNLKKWRHFRHVGLIVSFFAFSMDIICICNKHWTQGEAFHMGILDKCYYNTSLLEEDTLICVGKQGQWINMVCGLLIFTVVFGFLATILSICGTLASIFEKRLYYYHSSGEIYFICALLCTMALLVYPAAIEFEETMVAHTYGYGYGIGWAASFCFFISALFMCIDNVIQCIKNGICCRKCKTEQKKTKV